jgi:hypothetical protein
VDEKNFGIHPMADVVDAAAFLHSLTISDCLQIKQRGYSLLRNLQVLICFSKTSVT